MTNIRGDDSGDEELRAIGVLASVRHACMSSVLLSVAGQAQLHTQKTLLGVAQLEVLILELVAVDRLATGACTQLLPGQLSAESSRQTVTVGEVTTLDHKVLDDAVESRALVAEALLTGSQSPGKALGSLILA